MLTEFCPAYKKVRIGQLYLAVLENPKNPAKGLPWLSYAWLKYSQDAAYAYFVDAQFEGQSSDMEYAGIVQLGAKEVECPEGDPVVEDVEIVPRARRVCYQVPRKIFEAERKGP